MFCNKLQFFKNQAKKKKEIESTKFKMYIGKTDCKPYKCFSLLNKLSIHKIKIYFLITKNKRKISCGNVYLS